MERLTTNKNVSDMGIVELALNCCYIAKDGSGRYRDYEIDMDERDFVRKLTTTLVGEDLPLQDESFDEEMMDNLGIDPFADVRGLIAIFYRNMWAMAELREKLKRYEDAEEQGLILPAPLDDVESFSLDGKTTWYKSPCRVGDTVYMIDGATSRGYDWKYFTYEKAYVRETIFTIECINSFGKTIFLTRDEAEAKLKEMEDSHDGEQSKSIFGN